MPLGFLYTAARATEDVATGGNDIFYANANSPYRGYTIWGTWHEKYYDETGDPRASYAVIWRSGDGPVRPGKLVLGPTSFHLETGKPGGRLSAQRIRYADRETNYCAACQTGGKVLADRGLSRLLGADWPRTLEELEEGGQEGRDE